MLTCTRGSQRMEMRSQDYGVRYDPETQTVYLQGKLRLAGSEEYAPIAQLLKDAAQPVTKLTIDLQDLQFLNSSGINMLSQFVIKVRQRGGFQLIVVGNQLVSWQGKSLKNLQRLMPSLQLRFE